MIGIGIGDNSVSFEHGHLVGHVVAYGIMVQQGPNGNTYFHSLHPITA